MYNDILAIIGGLAGLGGFISMLVNVLKVVGIAKDGSSGKWYQTLNLITFLIIAIVYIMQLKVDWLLVNDWLKILALLAGYIMQAFAGNKAYELLEGTPIIGYRHTK